MRVLHRAYLQISAHSLVRIACHCFYSRIAILTDGFTFVRLNVIFEQDLAKTSGKLVYTVLSLSLANIINTYFTYVNIACRKKVHAILINRLRVHSVDLRLVYTE